MINCISTQIQTEITISSELFIGLDVFFDIYLGCLSMPLYKNVQFEVGCYIPQYSPRHEFGVV